MKINRNQIKTKNDKNVIMQKHTSTLPLCNEAHMIE